MSGTFNSIGQESNCADAELYTLVFKELKFYKKKAVDIQIGYLPSEFTINSINEMNLFNENEIEEFNKPSLRNIDYLSCTDLNNQVQSILSDDLIKANGSYNSHRFSKVITLSDSKKCILMKIASKNKRYKGGKIVGHEIIYILTKNKGKWVLSDKKSALMY